LEEVVEGQVTSNPHGCFYWIRRTAADFHTEAATLLGRYRRLFAAELRGDLALLRPAAPERVLFLDIETTGLTATPLFLIGVGYLSANEMVTEQFLARNYAEEAAVLEHFRDLLTRFQVLVSFNGKSFDVRTIQDRSIYHRLPFDVPHPHLDLLPLARRRWGRQFGDCRLGTLERWACGRFREGDIPGEQIPQVYHDFVRTGNGRLLEPVLYHNAMDLVTMVELLTVLAEPEGNRRERRGAWGKPTEERPNSAVPIR